MITSCVCKQDKNVHFVKATLYQHMIYFPYSLRDAHCLCFRKSFWGTSRRRVYSLQYEVLVGVVKSIEAKRNAYLF